MFASKVIESHWKQVIHSVCEEQVKLHTSLQRTVVLQGVQQYDRLVRTMSRIAYNTVTLNADEGRSFNKQLFGLVGAVALSLGMCNPVYVSQQ